jgi:uncharacterized membrane protein YhaH (DUF805 family)
MTLVRLLFFYDGRINRAQFWLGFLISVACILVSSLGFMPTYNILHTPGPAGHHALPATELLAVFGIAVGVIVFFAVCSKRWHDLGRSGGWSALVLVPIPLVPPVIVLHLGMTRGKAGANRYGPSTEDYTKTRKTYEAAATRGSATAMRGLGLLYLHGLGVAQDHERAREWLEKAIEKGDAQAAGLLEQIPPAVSQKG